MKRAKEGTIGWRIRLLRKQQRLTQTEFGKKIYTTKGTVRNWESNISSPQCDFVIAICKTFDVSADWLLGLKGEEKS